MMRIEVEPGWLGVAAADHSALGDTFAGLGSDMTASADAAVAGAGDPALGHGIRAAAAQLGAGLGSLTAEMHGLASSLAAAGQAYAATDESAMPVPR
jgi:Excreted virulence factor EspC, type VII ESX diderm